MKAHRDELLAKKAKLAELKRQRELRATAGRTSIGTPSDLTSPTPSSRTGNRQEIEDLINSLVGENRPVSTSTGGAASPAHRGSRPNSVSALSTGELSNENSEYAAPANGAPPQILSTIPLATIYECPPSPVKEVFTYSKGVQTTDEWVPPNSSQTQVEDAVDDVPPTTPKRLSRRERDREEEIRQNIRREIEEELRAARDLITDGVVKTGALSTTNFPVRALSAEELKAVTASEEFVDFVERSTKVIERALDEYDILTDYSLQVLADEDEDDQTGNVGGKGRRRVKEVIQFFDERWSKKRMITAIDFSPKWPDLLLASYTKNPTAPHDPDGLVQVWSLQLRERPEYVFHAQSDVLAAKFSPFHPNLIVGGSYSGQILLWDTRAKSAPVQKTLLTGLGHTHPVYSLDIVGTQNAHNIVSSSTDGTVCVWSIDMFAQPQESLVLTTPPPAKIDDLSPLCMSFPHGDPTYFLVGSEEGTIFPCHRFDRAGAKAGVDGRVSYKGHAAPVMSVDFHPAKGPVDLGDLVLSSSLDWSAKLWKVRAPAATSSIAAGSDPLHVEPLLDFVREDVVYDAVWSPVKPGVFALVDGAGWLELWDITVDTEEPVARISPTPRKADSGRAAVPRSLNKVAWDRFEGKRLATGGIDGAVTMFEVGPDLGGKESLKNEEWTAVRKLVARIEALGVNGSHA